MPENLSLNDLGLILVSLVFGANFAVMIQFDALRPKLILAFGFGFLGALVYYSAPGTAPLLVWIYVDAGCAALASVLSVLVLMTTIRLFAGKQRSKAWLHSDKILNGKYWPGNARSDEFDAIDHSRRWFVTISAATGGVLGAVAANQIFWDAALAALAPERILFTILLASMSIFVIGPVESFVFRDSEGFDSMRDTESSAVARILGQMSWRALGRLFLVGLAVFGLNVVETCFAEGAVRRDTRVLLQMLVGGVEAGVVTYYWATALQWDADSVRWRAGKASLLMGACLCYCTVLPGVVAFTNQHLADPVQNFGAGVILALLATGLLATGIAGAPAFVGGWVLDVSRTRPDITTARTTLVMALAVGAVVVFADVAIGLAERYLSNKTFLLTDMFFPVSVVIGWMAALLFSDFPRIVMDAKQKRLPPETYEGQGVS